MADLRQNVIVSTVAMVLVGLIRPGFHAIVNRVFGAEVNGHAAALIAVMFLASLPATSALPAVMIRHVSRAVGAGRDEEVRGHVRMALAACGILALLGAAGGAGYAHYALDPGPTSIEVVFVAVGVVGYAGWRLLRAVMLAIGKVVQSLWAEMISVAALFGGLFVMVMMDAPGWVLGAFAGVYVLYTLLAVPMLRGVLARGHVSAEGRRDFVRYNVLWFLGTATSLATRELTLLYLDGRVERALVGEVSVALSLLMLLAFAPRIIELPLVHELSALGGGQDREAQRKLTEKAMHWLTAFTFAVGTGAALLGGPILAIVGDIHTPVVTIAFALLAFAFMTEMMVTPATNLLVAEAPPSVLTTIGIVSMLFALAWWALPWSQSVVGVVSGLAGSYAIKAIGIGGYAKYKFDVALMVRAKAKLVALLAAAAALGGVFAFDLNPWLAFTGFEAVMALLFFPEAKQMISAVLARRAA